MKFIILIVIVLLAFFIGGIIPALIALFIVCFIFSMRKYVPKDDFEAGLYALEKGEFITALYKLQPLAEEGHADAQFNLGTMYLKGDGVRKDYGQTAKWYTLAAKQGHLKAQMPLGAIYKSAAEQGDIECQHRLGKMYIDANNFPHSDVKAYMWLSLAASRGFKDETDLIDTITKRMTPEQIAEAEKLAQEWLDEYQKLTDNGRVRNIGEFSVF